jgi:uncharacterized protein YkwD
VPMARRDGRRTRVGRTRRGRSDASRRRALPLVLLLLAALGLGQLYRRIAQRPDGDRGPVEPVSGPLSSLGSAVGRVAAPCVPPTDLARAARQPEAESPQVASQIAIAELLADTLTNEQRQEAGLAKLEPRDELRAIARAHSRDMQRRAFFSHQNPDGWSASDRVHRADRGLVGESGENIWMCRNCWRKNPDALAEAVVLGQKGWMNSPAHRRNILRQSFTHGVVGIWQAGSNVWATQVFADTRGLLQAYIPQRLDRRSCVQLQVEPYPATAARAVGFDLLSLSSDAVVLNRNKPGAAVLDAAPGKYQLRFYFPNIPGRLSVVRGPTVQLQ